jgi:hypothetical protein
MDERLKHAGRESTGRKDGPARARGGGGGRVSGGGLGGGGGGGRRQVTFFLSLDFSYKAACAQPLAHSVLLSPEYTMLTLKYTFSTPRQQHSLKKGNFQMTGSGQDTPAAPIPCPIKQQK